jgi:hypothetical protein
MRNTETLAVAHMMGDLARQVDEMKSRVEHCDRYIIRAHQKRDDLIAELDEVIREQHEDLQGYVQGLHDKLIGDWPEKPYHLRKDYY